MVEYLERQKGLNAHRRTAQQCCQKGFIKKLDYRRYQLSLVNKSKLKAKHEKSCFHNETVGTDRKIPQQ